MSSKVVRQIALIGEPNVGKSTLFTRLTGVGVISSNYPGTTVEFEEATLLRNGETLHFHDLPGTYSLSTNSDDERVVIEMLADVENDVIIVRKQPDVNNGEIAVVLVNGDDATVKKVHKQGNGISLVPINPTYSPIFFRLPSLTDSSAVAEPKA